MTYQETQNRDPQTLRSRATLQLTHLRWRTIGRKRSGVILVITLLAMLLLAAIIFFVINIGQEANTRLLTQHSADATAVAGAGWVARSFNTVAMNNVAIARHIATASVLDSLPLATQTSLPEQMFFRGRLQATGQISAIHPRLTQVVSHQRQLMLDELGEQISMLQPMADFFINQNTAEITHYVSPQGAPGKLWQAMQSHDEFSQTVMENLSPLTALNASRAGRVNMQSVTADSAAIMLPLHLEIPWLRGQFRDFEKPVMRGTLPPEVDHPILNRGPFDAVFGWWEPHRESSGTTTYTDGVSSGSVQKPFGGPGGHVHHQYNVVGYETYGTFGWSLRQIWHLADHFAHRPNLRHTACRYYPFVTGQALNKISYLWPQEDHTGPRRFAIPDWDEQYPQNLPNPGETLPFSETGYLQLDIKSKFPRNHPQFMADSSSWWFEGERRFDGTYNIDRSAFRIHWNPGWWLPRYIDGNGAARYMRTPGDMDGIPGYGTITSLGGNIWLYEFNYTVLQDQEIGITLELNPDGHPVPQPVFFLQVIVYGGINRHPVPGGAFDPARYAVTDETTAPPVVNPYDGFDPLSPAAPAPVDFDHAVMGVRSPEARKRLTFLAIARMSDRAILWPNRFTSAKTYPYKVALSCADVFNDHSWDLWTQMWHAQPRLLQTEGQSELADSSAPTFEEWLNVLGEESQQGLPPLVPPEELQDLHRYLESLRELAPLMMTH